ncbi:MAG TPA: PQQ-binding-like beta-propeller repeat protein [Pyrinomonadaceae bacterium]|nr:PQQ-binding-like beta-propeller repeat protein [Pyrinomonadaceae bacterium]
MKHLKSNLLFLLILLPAAAFAQSTEWSQWRGANRDGKVAVTSLPQTWPKTLKEQWKVTVGVGHSSPVVADGKIYVFARQGDEEVLLCLDAVTGKQIWKSSYPVAYEMNPAASGHGKGPKATPVVSNGNVYTFGITGVLSGHNARTGELQWRRDFAANYPATSPLYGTAMSPLVEDGLVIVHVGGPDKGALRAFDVGRGAIKWSNNTDGPAYASPIVATLAGVRQVVSFMQKDLVGIDFANGKMLWRVPAKSGYDTNSVTPLIYKDMIVVAREDQGLTAFRLVKRGADLVTEEVWSNKQVELYMNTPVLEGNQLTGLSVRNKGQFFSIDADTGKTLWLGAGRMGENAGIVNVGGKVLLMLTNDANLIVHPLNAKEYAPAAQYTVAASQTWAHPLLFGKQILIKDLSTLTSFAIEDK